MADTESLGQTPRYGEEPYEKTATTMRRAKKKVVPSRRK
jgi:hypothetical protein